MTMTASCFKAVVRKTAPGHGPERIRKTLNITFGPVLTLNRFGPVLTLNRRGKPSNPDFFWQTAKE